MGEADEIRAYQATDLWSDGYAVGRAAERALHEAEIERREAEIERLREANDHLGHRIENDAEHKAAGHLWLATAWFRLAWVGQDDDGSLWRIVPVDDEQRDRALADYRQAVLAAQDRYTAAIEDSDGG